MPPFRIPLKRKDIFGYLQQALIVFPLLVLVQSFLIVEITSLFNKELFHSTQEVVSLVLILYFIKTFITSEKVGVTLSYEKFTQTILFGGLFVAVCKLISLFIIYLY